MQTVLVTGSAGFIGRHLMEALGRRPDTRVFGYDVGNTAEELDRALAEADVIYHLAGVNRPQDPKEYQTGNAGFTEALCASLQTLGRKPTIVLSSSIQAEMDTPYGISKRQAERVVEDYGRGREGKAETLKAEMLKGESGDTGDGGQKTEDGGRRTEDGGREGKAETLKAEILKGKSDGGQEAKAIIFRLKNVFGKWCRPNYNSVVATFCHNIAHDLPISISDPDKELELVYIDDVVAAFTALLDQVHPSTVHRPPSSDLCCYREVERSFKVTLGELASKIRAFRESRQSLRLPSFADAFTRCLYATYLSYLEVPDFAYNLDIKTDNRGCLAEFIKSEHFGQFFISRTKPGITRGNHYHHTKTEKFLVVEGVAVIRFRSIQKLEDGGRKGKAEILKAEMLKGEDGTADDGGRKTEDRGRGGEVEIGEVESRNAEVIEYRVSGSDFRVLDIPPGYTHSIENVGNTEMVVLFWASEIFDPAKPDTIALPVLG